MQNAAFGEVAMKPVDIGKGAAMAIAIMAVNVAISVVVIGVYSYAIAPGHDAAYYQAIAPRMAPWSSVVFGAPLFLAAAYVAARKRPARNAIAFAAVMVGVYALVDLSVLFAAGAVASQAGIIALSLTTKLLGALTGARLGSSFAQRRDGIATR